MSKHRYLSKSNILLILPDNTRVFRMLGSERTDFEIVSYTGQYINPVDFDATYLYIAESLIKQQTLFSRVKQSHRYNSSW